MTDGSLQQFLESGVSQYPPNSRYHGVETARLTMADGREVMYVRRRFLPLPESLATSQYHTVAAQERPDTIAARYHGDPLLAWQLCDANNVMDMQELTQTPGGRIRIALPAGIPEQPHD